MKMPTIKDWPVDERPRERLIQSGAEHLSDTELLAVLLGRGAPGLSAVDLARSLLTHFGGIRGVLSAQFGILQAIHGFL